MSVAGWTGFDEGPQVSRERLIADTCALIRAAGENPSPTDTEAATATVLHRLLTRIGARVTLQEVYPGRPNLWARLGPEVERAGDAGTGGEARTGGTGQAGEARTDGEAPALLFLGHSDVVPAGTGWSTAPFEPVVAGGRIYGRGAADMKGGLASIVAAMEAVSKVAPHVRLDLLCTVDEEDRSTGIVAALENWDTTRYLACIVAEPTDLDVVVGCRGAANMLIYFEGASAHAGRPEDGASAVQAAALAVDVIAQKHTDARAGVGDPLFGTESWNVGTIFGGETASMVAPTCRLGVDHRMLPGADPNAVLEELLAEIRGAIAASGMHGAERISVTGVLDMAMPGFRVGEDTAVVAAASAAVESVGVSPRVTGWSAACEGGWVAGHHGAPTIILGPGDVTTQAHQPDESVGVDQLEAAALAYVRVVLALLG